MTPEQQAQHDAQMQAFLAKKKYKAALRRQTEDEEANLGMTATTRRPRWARPDRSGLRAALVTAEQMRVKASSMQAPVPA